MASELELRAFLCTAEPLHSARSSQSSARCLGRALPPWLVWCELIFLFQLALSIAYNHCCRYWEMGRMWGSPSATGLPQVLLRARVHAVYVSRTYNMDSHLYIQHLPASCPLCMAVIAASDTRLKSFFLGSLSGVQGHSSILHASPSEEH